MTFILIAFLVTLGLCITALLPQWIGLRCARTAVHKILIFQGKPIATFPLLGTQLVIGYIPTGGSLEFDLERFNRLPVWVRLAILLAGPATLLLTSAILLRHNAAFHHFVGGFSELFTGALHPRTHGVELVARLHAVFVSSFLTLVGIIACKLAVVTLIPFGGSTGCRCLHEIFIRNPESRWFHKFQVTTFLLMVITLGAWIFACYLHVFQIPK